MHHLTGGAAIAYWQKASWDPSRATPLFCSPPLPGQKRLFCYASRSTTTIALADCPHFRLEIILKTFTPSRLLPSVCLSIRLCLRPSLLARSFVFVFTHSACHMLLAAFCNCKPCCMLSRLESRPPSFGRALIPVLVPVLVLVLVPLLFTT